MVAVPETAGVHWWTRSGEVPELPQLPTSALVPLVAPLTVPPAAGRTIGLLHPPLPGRAVVVVGGAGGVIVRLKVPCAPPYPSTTMKYVCPAVTVGARRSARFRPAASAHTASVQPAAT